MLVLAGVEGGAEGAQAGRPPTAKPLVRACGPQQQVNQRAESVIKSSKGRLTAALPDRPRTTAAAAAATASRPFARKLNIMHHQPPPLHPRSPPVSTPPLMCDLRVACPAHRRVSASSLAVQLYQMHASLHQMAEPCQLAGSAITQASE